MAFCARIIILCACYLYSVIELTPSPWDSWSRIELTPSPWDSGSQIDNKGSPWVTLSFFSRDYVYISPRRQMGSFKLYLYQLRAKLMGPGHRWRTVHSMSNLERFFNPFVASPMKISLRISHPISISLTSYPLDVPGFLYPACASEYAFITS